METHTLIYVLLSFSLVIMIITGLARGSQTTDHWAHDWAFLACISTGCMTALTAAVLIAREIW